MPVSVLLTSNGTGVSMPTSISIPPGAGTMPFSLATPAGKALTVTITAKIVDGKGPGASANLVVKP